MLGVYIFLVLVVCVLLLVVCGNFINLLIVLENFNILVLFFCILNNPNAANAAFVSLLVIMTLEVALGLVIISRVWFLGDLGFMVLP